MWEVIAKRPHLAKRAARYLHAGQTCSVSTQDQTEATGHGAQILSRGRPSGFEAS